MKQKKLLLPIIATFVALLASCVPAPSMPPVPNTEKIIEEIKSSFSDNIAENIHEKLSKLSSAVNDTIISVNATGDTVRATVSKMDKSAPISVTVEGLNVTVKSPSDKNYFYLERDRIQTFQGVVITVVIVLFLLLTILAVLYFFYRRAKGRNEIIAKAIENNYQLPESFYSGMFYKGWMMDMIYDNTPKPEPGATSPECKIENSASTLTGTSSTTSQPIPPVYKRTQNFEKGKRNIAIGIGVILVFSVWAAPALAVLGVIPLLIGIGQLLSLKK
ncbi:MAG: hypothetical protein K2K27_01760 [Muribaculaceae bacterium]|nr:hypothetical protein [Muribaculaceae bacterium]MDE6642811.1 hypothetical protein [Muribaculaceae bacterium]